MAYCTRADIVQAVGGESKLRQLTDREGTGSVDETVVTAAIATADALIDTYANKRFSVPFDPVPPAIKELSKRIARYTLRDERGTLTEGDLKTHEADVKWLDALQKGEVSPGIEPQPTKSSLVRDAATERPSAKAVGRAQLKGFC